MSVPTCAICMKPIESGKFLLLATEVVHRACAANGGRTAMWKLRVEIEESKAQRESEQRELADAKNQLAKLRAELRSAQETSNALRSLNLELTSHLNLLETLRMPVRAIQAGEKPQAVPVPVVDAPAQHIAASPPPSSADQKLPSPDPTELRFSLLEIDPL